MDRRDFITVMAAIGGAPAFALARPAAAETVTPTAPQTLSGAAFQDLLVLLREVERRYLGPEWNITQPRDIADGHRLMLHLLAAGLDLHAEADPERPVFRKIVTPTRKFEGDNPDALYFSAAIRADRSYRIRGNIAGAVYTSISMEIGSAEGHFPSGVARALSDADLKVAPNGDYELILGPDPRPGNWFKLETGVGSVTTRHYFETEISVAADPAKVIPLSIEPLDTVGPKPAPTDASIAAGYRRVGNWLRGCTLEQPPMARSGKIPNWVSLTPNQFKPAELPDGAIGFANRDAHYAMAPYALKPDEALVMDGRFPRGRFANVMLWNRFLQTYDYLDHRVSLNRTQTKIGPDGGFRIVIAHRDPGLPNWLDTQGLPSGLVFWRFIFPDEQVPPVIARVVPFADLAKLPLGR